MASDKPSSTIKFSELKRVIDGIFSHLENEMKIHELEIGDNLYYDLNIDDKFGDIKTPPEPDVGDLIDDLHFLKKSVEDEKVLPPSIMFMHVAPILKYIAHRIGQ